MQKLLSAFLLIVAAGCFLTESVAHAQWGNLKGKFVFDGDPPDPAKLNITKDKEACTKKPLFDESLVIDEKSKGVANIILYCRERRVDVHESYKNLPESVDLDNNCCRFAPHVVILTLDQKLKILNSDAVAHNAAGTPPADIPFNPLIPPNGEYLHQFQRAQRVPVPINCSIHPWMNAWVLPRDNPYFAVTDEEGNFEIKNLPAGELEFQAWQEKVGYLEAKDDWRRGRFEVEIEDGKTVDLGTIKLSASLFEE